MRRYLITRTVFHVSPPDVVATLIGESFRVSRFFENTACCGHDNCPAVQFEGLGEGGGGGGLGNLLWQEIFSHFYVVHEVFGWTIDWTIFFYIKKQDLGSK